MKHSLAKNIAHVRRSVVALLKVSAAPVVGQFALHIVGTAWCAVANRVFVTAWHVLNSGQARRAEDRFYLLYAPDNGPKLHFFPVQQFVLEDSAADLAAFVAVPPPGSGLHFPALALHTGPVLDGSPVLTYGYPSPVIAGARVSSEGLLQELHTGLFSHANEGIVSSQYAHAGGWLFELNVGWHIGESGGPVFGLEQHAVFAVMQFYRNIQSPHGVVAGPHCARSLTTIIDRLEKLEGVK